MATLSIDSNIARPDDFHEALIEMRRDLSTEQSHLVNAKLILLLANPIGNESVLREAMRRARRRRRCLTLFPFACLRGATR